MSGGKASPRQKMINMMYLVLTALLALNVSKEILKAFHLVETSMVKSGLNIDEKNASIIKAFEKSFADNPKKTEAPFNKAKDAVKIANELVKYIETLKTELEKQAGGRKDDGSGELVQPDNIEMHANLLINKGKAKELKAKINDTRTKLLALVDDKEKKNIKSDLVTLDGHHTWESEMFEHPPLAAVMTLLTKIQNDAKNTQSQVLDHLIKSIDANDFKFDKLQARIIAKSTNVMIGQEYSADIFVAASSSTQDNEILVNGRAIEVKEGVGTYKINPNSEGNFEYKGVINVKNPSGEIESYPFTGEYTAFAPTATIAADAMNVLYVGLENPVSVGVPGAAPDQIVAAISKGTMSGAKGKYKVTVPRGTKEVEIVASVKQKDGQVKRMTAKKYRVKEVPSPVPSLGGVGAGDVSAIAIKANPNVMCKLDGFVFEGVFYQTLSFSVAYIPKRGGSEIEENNVQGFALPGRIKAALNGAKTGDKILVWDIKATAKGTNIGTKILPTGISLRIK